MNIEASVKYLEYNKLKMKLQMILMELMFSKKFLNYIEKSLNKDVFKRKPYVLNLTLDLIYTVFNFIIFEILYLLLPKMFTIDTLIVYFIEIILLTILLSLFQLKKDFFDYFPGDHFFNILQNNQSEFISRRIKAVYINNVFGFLIPTSLPLYIHLSIDFKLFYFIIIYPLVILFIYQFIQIFGVLYWYIYAFMKKNIILKLIFNFIKIFMSALIIFGIFIVFSYFVMVYVEGTQFVLSDKFYNAFSLVAIGLLIVFNGSLYIVKDAPQMIIQDSYKKIIYTEGYKKTKLTSNKEGFLLKLLSLGMFRLDEKEKAIYQKDTKKLLRKENAKVYVLIVSLLAIFFSNIKVTSSGEAIVGFYFLANFLLAFIFGYFMVVHKYISSFSAEESNHVIYNRLHVNFYKVFKAKLRFHRFLVLAPCIPFFLVAAFGIANIEDLFIIIAVIIYLYGITSVVIKATMIEDFFYPTFNGLSQIGIIGKKSTYLSNFYTLFLIYSFFIFPFMVSYFIQVVNLWVIISILLSLIYLVNYTLYRKSKKLKKAESISYGGVIYVES